MPGKVDRDLDVGTRDERTKDSRLYLTLLDDGPRRKTRQR